MAQMAMSMDNTQGIIVNYHIAYTKEVLVSVPGILSKRDAARLVGKKAIFTDRKGGKYMGIVTGLHGRSGTLKVKFNAPLPSTALAQRINIAG